MIFWIFARSLGCFFADIFVALGRFFSFVMQIFYEGVRRPFYGKQLIQSIWEMLFCALPLLSLASFCTGMVLAFQTGDGFSRFGVGSDFALPEVVSLSMVRELAPVLSGLMMSGRWAASITSELASMRLTSQIDALFTLSVNPIRYLVVPRLVSAMLAMPFLVLASSVSGIVGGYVMVLRSSPPLASAYIRRSLDVLLRGDVFLCVQKAAVFGLSIILIAIYNGWNVRGGSQEVGLFTTRSVVYSSTLVLLFNFLITSLST